MHNRLKESWSTNCARQEQQQLRNVVKSNFSFPYFSPLLLRLPVFVWNLRSWDNNVLDLQPLFQLHGFLQSPRHAKSSSIKKSQFTYEGSLYQDPRASGPDPVYKHMQFRGGNRESKAKENIMLLSLTYASIFFSFFFFPSFSFFIILFLGGFFFFGFGGYKQGGHMTRKSYKEHKDSN